jgi:hypothetical protein
MSKNITHLSNNIYIVENFYDGSEELLNYIELNKKNYQYHSGDHAYNFCTESNDAFYEKGVSLSRLIKDTVQNIFNTKLKHRDYLSITIYLEGGGKGLHSDEYHNADDLVNRQLIHVYTSVYYPNDNYSGGKLCFPDLELEISPKKNSLIVFPCQIPHLVSDIITGQRISLTDFWEVENEL